MKATRIAATALTALAVAVIGAAPASAVLDPTGRVTVANDWSGDGRPDIAALTTSGALYVYTNAGGSRFTARPDLVATGLRGFVWARIAGDVDDDGKVDILARTAAGMLWLFRGDGAGDLALVTPVSAGWSVFEEIVPIDLYGTGQVDLLALDRETNTLRVYNGNPGTSWRIGVTIPLGSQRWDHLTAFGDGDHDGYAELLVRDTATGRLIALELRPSGTFQHSSQHRVIGVGFGAFTALTAVGDFDGTGNPDVIVRAPDGRLIAYAGYGDGRLAKPYTIGTRWGSLIL